MPDILEDTYDVVIVGSGAAGMTAAIVAAHRGARVLIAEKADQLGGTTARSGARLWIPVSRYAIDQGVLDSRKAARRYIQHEAGADFDPAIVDAYLANGPAMVDFLDSHTAVSFGLDNAHSPDYSPHSPGAAPGGRTVFPLDMKSAEIGGDWARIAPFRRWGTFLGIQIGAGPEMEHFMKAARSVRSLLFVAGEIARNTLSLALYRRPAMLRDGNALIGRLLVSAKGAGVAILTATPVIDLLVEGQSVVGVKVEHDGAMRSITARKAVVLATGGIGQNAVLRGKLFEHVAAGAEHLSASAPGATGDGIVMATKAGAQLRTFGGRRNGAWAPMLRDPRVAGSDANVPSFTRAVPGTVVVSRKGRRIGNEADYYPDFVQHMFSQADEDETHTVEAFIVGDHRAMRRYGFGTGLIRPFPFPLRPHLRSGLLVRAETLAELASKTGIDEQGLKATIDTMNLYAHTGVDKQFGRGSTPFYPNRKRNPFLGRIDQPPFYSVRILAGDIGSFAGIKTDENAQVLNIDGAPIKGLYAIGNDMASPFGGDYPGKGGTIGPAMTFAYVAGRHITG